MTLGEKEGHCGYSCLLLFDSGIIVMLRQCSQQMTRGIGTVLRVDYSCWECHSLRTKRAWKFQLQARSHAWMYTNTSRTTPMVAACLDRRWKAFLLHHTPGCTTSTSETVTAASYRSKHSPTDAVSLGAASPPNAFPSAARMRASATYDSGVTRGSWEPRSGVV
jgi:hypothetical protein